MVSNKRKAHVLDFLVRPAVLRVHGAAFACAGDLGGCAEGADGILLEEGGGGWAERLEEGCEEAE